MNYRTRTATYPLMITCFIFVSILSACGRGGDRQDYYLPHVGVWEGVDSGGIKATMVLRGNGIGTIRFPNKVVEFRYVFDYSKNPVWVDIIHNRPEKPFRERLIARFEDKNHWRWRTFYTEVRPTDFSRDNKGFNAVFTRVGTPETV